MTYNIPPADPAIVAALASRRDFENRQQKAQSIIEAYNDSAANGGWKADYFSTPDGKSSIESAQGLMASPLPVISVPDSPNFETGFLLQDYFETKRNQSPETGYSTQGYQPVPEMKGIDIYDIFWDEVARGLRPAPKNDWKDALQSGLSFAIPAVAGGLIGGAVGTGIGGLSGTLAQRGVQAGVGLLSGGGKGSVAIPQQQSSILSPKVKSIPVFSPWQRSEELPGYAEILANIQAGQSAVQLPEEDEDNSFDWKDLNKNKTGFYNWNSIA